MYRSPGRRGPKRKLTAEQEAAAIRLRADALLAQIRHWLGAMEKFHNLHNAPKRPFTVTYCTSGGGDHWWHVRLIPRPPRRSTYVACTAPRDKLPDDALLERVTKPLRDAGFTVSETTDSGCGCATFTVRPRRLAGA